MFGTSSQQPFSRPGTPTSGCAVVWKPSITTISEPAGAPYIVSRPLPDPMRRLPLQPTSAELQPIPDCVIDGRFASSKRPSVTAPALGPAPLTA